MLIFRRVKTHQDQELTTFMESINVDMDLRSKIFFLFILIPYHGYYLNYSLKCMLHSGLWVIALQEIFPMFLHTTVGENAHLRSRQTDGNSTTQH